MAADGYEAVLTNLFEEDLDTELAWRAHEVGPGSAASFLDSFEQAKDAAVSFPAFMPHKSRARIIVGCRLRRGLRCFA